MASQTLADLRADFDAQSKGSMSLPMAGLIVWLVIAVLGVVLPAGASILALVFATGAIFPIGMLIARARGEALITNTNPLAKLMGLAVLMVNLLWALHLPLLLNAAQFVPLSIGIGLGLHWIIYGWIVEHRLGIQHAVVRSVGLAAVWLTFPDDRVTACSLVVVAAYVMTLVQMRGRLVRAHAPTLSP